MFCECGKRVTEAEYDFLDLIIPPAWVLETCHDQSSIASKGSVSDKSGAIWKVLHQPSEEQVNSFFPWHHVVEGLTISVQGSRPLLKMEWMKIIYLIYWSKWARTNNEFSKIKQFKKFDIVSCYFLKTVPAKRF